MYLMRPLIKLKSYIVENKVLLARLVMLEAPVPKIRGVSIQTNSEHKNVHFGQAEHHEQPLIRLFFTQNIAINSSSSLRFLCQLHFDDCNLQKSMSV